ncbi:MAG: hypothetical protein M3Q14_00245 [bacterium]|nr:hypothetical protein [bacterium]
MSLYEQFSSPNVNELLALRPEPTAAVVHNLATTHMQEVVLAAIINAGTDGIPTTELAERTELPKTKLQRIVNVLRYERPPAYHLIRPFTDKKIFLDNNEYSDALAATEYKAAEAELALRAIGDTAVSKVLELATVNDRSETISLLNRETMIMLLSHAGLNSYQRHFFARYVAQGILTPDFRDQNFTRRIQFMLKLPLFSRAITINKTMGHSTYTVDPINLTEAYDSGLVTIPSNIMPASKLKSQKFRLPTPPKSVLSPTSVPPTNKSRKQIKEITTAKKIKPLETGVPLIILSLPSAKAAAASRLLDRLTQSRGFTKISLRERAVLAGITNLFEAENNATLFHERSDGSVRLTTHVRRSTVLIISD